LIAENPAGILAFYFTVFFPGPILTNRFHPILKIDDIGMGRKYDEACK
jgi:hypothetical protein